MVHGTAANTLFLGLENLPSGVIAWSLRSLVARRMIFHLPGRLLSAQPGTGRSTWLASDNAKGDVRLFRLTPSRVWADEGSLRTAGEPAAITWGEDGSGIPWIVLASIDRGDRYIEAYRREESVWRSKGRVAAADLRTPRSIPGSRFSIICGAWRFSSSRAPRRIPVSGEPDLAEIFPGRGFLTELRLEDLTVSTSRDSGLHWEAHPAPLPTTYDWPPEAIDIAGRAPMLRWVSRQRLHVMNFDHDAWQEILDIPVADAPGLNGPALTIGNSLAFISLCYRTAPGEPDSFRVGLIENAKLSTMTVTVASESLDVRVGKSGAADTPR